MNYGNSYIQTLESLKAESIILKQNSAKIRSQQKLIEKSLYDWMNANKLDNYKGYNREKIKPKEKIKIIRKKKKEKREDAIRLFIQEGFPDPEDLFEKFQMTQKFIPQEE